MHGLHDEGTLALDKAGLAARCWVDLPIDWIPEHGAVLHGGYGEDRAIYDTPIFNCPGEEPRTLHLGLDIFAAAGAPVFAPLDGQVHSLQRNDNAKDYGPTLILQHEAEVDLIFYTLYGHLDPDLLDTLQPGGRVKRGQEIARLGDSSVNGGWAPHLHFQVMLDMLGKRGDFPGVCSKSEAGEWLQLCPDPRALIGLAV
ncbi:peptidoglycan DD-metalloendopeptidase family protein [Henriciella barbarensis]|nr:peptidoglycan DD-metalloendopeptidase family protein [Henriciella barbarensis]